ncbi:MAG: nuclear transport factor 2 family protein [Anaerolineae bacterium]|nr:nuclear transport factor 2 family protein [Anaerolineae bacterium]
MDIITSAGSSDRATIENWVNRHLAAWETRDALAIGETLHPDIQFVLPTINWQERGWVQTALKSYLADCSALRLHLRHLLIDPTQRVAAVEWVGRYTRPAQDGCQEILGGTVLDFTDDGLIVRWRTYLDPVRQRTVADLEAPWPDEGWSPCPEPGPPLSRTAVEGVIYAYGQGWSKHNVAQLSVVIHEEMVVQPPWDYVVGRAAIEAGAQVYFANYVDTCVTPHRLILDSTQPHVGVCEQTFACTNPDTGQRGEDHDFAFFEIAQGKLRYWRTYFDTTHSAQVVEKTIGYLRR